jgi:predicted nucleotidyltransferase
VRLTSDQSRLITDRIRQYFGVDTKVWLFGSRVDDSRRGGDIDLYVEADHPEPLSELRCKISLEDALDLRVDLLLGKPGLDHPMHRIAKTQGVRL